MLNAGADGVLIINPLLYSDFEKYIWIGFSDQEHREAQRLLISLMQMNIYIDGFVTNDLQLSGLKMYNKEIFNLNVIGGKHSAIFYDICNHCVNNCIGEQKQPIQIINPELDKENIVIWGAGNTGESVYKLLENNGIKAKCFIDSDKKLFGTTKHGLPVFTPEHLNDLGKNIAIIEAVKQWELLDAKLMFKYDKRFYLNVTNKNINKVTYNIDGIEKTILNFSDFYMLSRFVGKKIYIYGNGWAENEFAKYLNLMDFEFAGFLIDEDNDMSSTENNRYSVKYVEDILYEENFYVWIYENKIGHRLRDLGLRYFLEYECAVFDWDAVIERRNLLDINLGYNYCSQKNKYPGITIYGNDSDECYKIAILGASTTDGTLYPFKSWPELLYEELGKKTTIYNGGVTGYVSGQELFKLIRDILVLKPDMILVYDGVSDLYTEDKNPFAFSYAKTVYEYANAHLEDNFIGSDDASVCLGVATENDKMTNWASNIRSMYAIANERNIKFFSFFQPRLTSKKGKTTEEKNLLLSMPDNPESLFSEKPLHRDLIQMIDKTDYMYDLSHIFDNTSDVYMDMFHVWEKGNRIIAKEIKNIIEPYLRQCDGNKKN